MEVCTRWHPLIPKVITWTWSRGVTDHWISKSSVSRRGRCGRSLDHSMWSLWSFRSSDRHIEWPTHRVTDTSSDRHTDWSHGSSGWVGVGSWSLDQQVLCQSTWSRCRLLDAPKSPICLRFLSQFSCYPSNDELNVVYLRRSQRLFSSWIRFLSQFLF